MSPLKVPWLNPQKFYFAKNCQQKSQIKLNHLAYHEYFMNRTQTRFVCVSPSLPTRIRLHLPRQTWFCYFRFDSRFWLSDIWAGSLARPHYKTQIMHCVYLTVNKSWQIYCRRWHKYRYQASGSGPLEMCQTTALDLPKDRAVIDIYTGDILYTPSTWFSLCMTLGQKDKGIRKRETGWEKVLRWSPLQDQKN